MRISRVMEKVKKAWPKGLSMHGLKEAHWLGKVKITALSRLGPPRERPVQPDPRLMRHRQGWPGGTYANLLATLKHYKYMATRKCVGEVVTAVNLRKGR